MASRRPAVRFVLLYIAGIFLGWIVDIPPWNVALALLLLALPLLVFLFRDTTRSRPLVPIAALILVFLFGLFKISFDTHFRSSASISRFTGEKEIPVRVKGSISEEIRTRATRSTCLLDAESLWTPSGGAYRVEGGVLLSIPKESLGTSSAAMMEYGRVITVSGNLQLPARARNPGEFDYRRYLLLHDVFAQLWVKGASDIAVAERAGAFPLVEIVYPLRRWIGETLDTLVGGEEAKLMKGLVIGERSDMSPEVTAAFTNTGLMHLLAVSGFNVGLVVLILYALCAAARLPRIALFGTMFAGLLFFGYLTGAQASVMRAVVMALVAVAGKLLERRVDLYNTVAASAFLLLLADARALFDVGFQLSFTAVIALAYLYPKIENARLHIPATVRDRWPVKYLVASFAVSLAATAGTFPLSAYYFQKVSLIGVLVNILAVPLSGVLLGAGFLTVLAAPVTSWIASSFAACAWAGSHLLLVMTTWSAGLSFASFPFIAHLPAVIGIYGGILVASGITKPAIRRAGVLAALLAANAMVYTGLASGDEQQLRVTFFDVGQGDAAFIEFPDGKNLLIDTGPRSRFTDAGGRFIGPFLKRRGITHLDAVIITHPHSDHIGGAPSLLRNFAVSEVIQPGIHSNSMLVRDVARLIDSLHIGSREGELGMTLPSMNTRLYIINPGEADAGSEERTLSFNNRSLVLKLQYGRTTLLFAGDAEAAAEAMMAARYGDFLRSDILKLGHHGSGTSTSQVFLDHVRPARGIISVARKNKFSLPSPSTLKNLEQMGCAVLRTDESGAIVLESDGLAWRSIDWR